MTKRTARTRASTTLAHSRPVQHVRAVRLKRRIGFTNGEPEYIPASSGSHVDGAMYEYIGYGED